MKPEFIKALNAIKAKLNVPKNKKNKFLNNAPYRSLEDILTVLNPLLIENNAALFMDEFISELSDGNYLRAKATFCVGDTEIHCETIVRLESISKGLCAEQISGRAISYARKYVLQGLFCLDDGLDADSAPIVMKPQAPVKKESWKTKLLNSIEKGEFERVRKVIPTLLDKKQLTPEDADFVTSTLKETEKKINFKH